MGQKTEIPLQPFIIIIIMPNLRCLHTGMSHKRMFSNSPEHYRFIMKACRGGRLLWKRWLHHSEAAGSLAAVSRELEWDWCYLFTAPKRGLSGVKQLAPKTAVGLLHCEPFYAASLSKKCTREGGTYGCLKAMHSHSVTLCILLHYELNLKTPDT